MAGTKKREWVRIMWSAATLSLFLSLSVSGSIKKKLQSLTIQHTTKQPHFCFVLLKLFWESFFFSSCSNGCCNCPKIHQVCDRWRWSCREDLHAHLLYQQQIPHGVDAFFHIFCFQEIIFLLNCHRLMLFLFCNVHYVCVCVYVCFLNFSLFCWNHLNLSKENCFMCVLSAESNPVVILWSFTIGFIWFCFPLCWSSGLYPHCVW